MSERKVTFLIDGEAYEVPLSADLPLGEGKRFAVHQARVGSPLAPAQKWEVRDESSYLLNESTLIGDLVDRDKVTRVLLTLPVGSGGS